MRSSEATLVFQVIRLAIKQIIKEGKAFPYARTSLRATPSPRGTQQVAYPLKPCQLNA